MAQRVFGDVLDVRFKDVVGVLVLTQHDVSDAEVLISPPCVGMLLDALFIENNRLLNPILL